LQNVEHKIETLATDRVGLGFHSGLWLLIFSFSSPRSQVEGTNSVQCLSQNTGKMQETKLSQVLKLQ